MGEMLEDVADAMDHAAGGDAWSLYLKRNKLILSILSEPRSAAAQARAVKASVTGRLNANNVFDVYPSDFKWRYRDEDLSWLRKLSEDLVSIVDLVKL